MRRRIENVSVGVVHLRHTIQVSPTGPARVCERESSTAIGSQAPETETKTCACLDVPKFWFSRQSRSRKNYRCSENRTGLRKSFPQAPRHCTGRIGRGSTQNGARVARELSRRKGFTSSGCRRFCGGESLQKQQASTSSCEHAATDSIKISCDLQNSINFNKLRNRVRDQGVAGSNPVSPTIFFNEIQPFPERLKIDCSRFCRRSIPPSSTSRKSR